MKRRYPGIGVVPTPDVVTLGSQTKGISWNKVVRRRVIGSRWQLKEALLRSEDSSKFNTSFIERLNLTIRHGSAYLCRRSSCHARSQEYLEKHMDLLKCDYNFVRPHSCSVTATMNSSSTSTVR